MSLRQLKSILSDFYLKLFWTFAETSNCQTRQPKNWMYRKLSRHIKLNATNIALRVGALLACRIMLLTALIFIFSWHLRSSCPEVFYKKGVLRNFTKLTGKHLCQSLFFNKVAGLCLKTPFHTEHLWWLLLTYPITIIW